ncbi:MAG TPA: hypothetical protein VG498_12370, partial [Terriglobales bacterium]|nr:hypothetical protein [Terriglobales bacterium]
FETARTTAGWLLIATAVRPHGVRKPIVRYQSLVIAILIPIVNRVARNPTIAVVFVRTSLYISQRV